MDAFDAVRTTVRQESSLQGRLPPLLEPAIKLFSYAGIYWRAFKLGRAFGRAAENPSNGNPVVYGAALHLAADYTSLHTFLNIALVAKCAEDLLREYRHVSEEYRRLIDAIKGQYPVYQQVKWENLGRAGEAMPPSFFLGLQIRIMKIADRILRVGNCLKDLMIQIFKLSMVFNDTRLVLTADRAARFEAFTELVSEWSQYRTQLEEDKKRLQEELERVSGLADQILVRMNAGKIAAVLSAFKKYFGYALKQVDFSEEEAAYHLQGLIDPVLVPGKISSLHIELPQSKNVPLEISKALFPAWGGQKIEDEDAPPQTLPDAVDPDPAHHLSDDLKVYLPSGVGHDVLSYAQKFLDYLKA